MLDSTSPWWVNSLQSRINKSLIDRQVKKIFKFWHKKPRFRVYVNDSGLFETAKTFDNKPRAEAYCRWFIRGTKLCKIKEV